MGVSDGWQDLSQHKQLTWAYDRAEDGNVALTGEVDLGACGGVFVLAVGFGRDDAEAGHRALASVLDDLDDLQTKYVRGWQDWQETLSPPRLAGKAGATTTGSARPCYRPTTPRVFRVRSSPASQPLGESREGTRSGKRGRGVITWSGPATWSRRPAACSRPEESRKGYACSAICERRRWPTAIGPRTCGSAALHSGPGSSSGRRLLPILLLDLLRREGGLPNEELARFWPMVRRAVSYIVRSGPSTQQDRWEDQMGYTPFTLAAVIAALLIAAELADNQNEAAVGTYLRETADAWNAAIESWLYVTGTDLAHRVGVEGYYVRSIPPELDEASTLRIGHVTLKGTAPVKGDISITEIVSVDALALVRFGLRAPDDPRIVNTVKVIDAVLKVETPRGPAWHRFSGDAYGEKKDGSPYDGSAGGIGRAWPLLTGERAHFELEAGRRDEAIRLLRAMESLAGDGGMIPEQVWDTDDIPARGLCRGKPSGSAMPLAWAHAEYLKLRRSLQDGRTFDRPPQTALRYLEQKTGSQHAVWRFEHPRRAISPGEVLRVEILAPAVVHWSTNAWKTSHDSRTRDTGLGVHVADLDTATLNSNDTIELTFHWTGPDRWEGKNFAVSVV